MRAEANAVGWEYRTQLRTWFQNFLIQPGTPELRSDSIHLDHFYLGGWKMKTSLSSFPKWVLGCLSVLTQQTSLSRIRGNSAV